MRTGIDPIALARAPASHWETCAGFVARWLASAGWSTTPSRLDICRAWKEHGVLEGCAIWCALIGLEPCAPAPHCVAVARQQGGEMLVGVVDASGYFVTRSFGVMLVATPHIVAAWRIPKAGGANV